MHSSQPTYLTLRSARLRKFDRPFAGGDVGGSLGAIAIDAAAGVPGAIVGRESKELAERTALDICQKNGGTHCKILITFHNQCAVVAQSSKGGSLFGSSAFPKEQAEARALKKCHDSTCQIRFSDCSLPKQIR